MSSCGCGGLRGIIKGQILFFRPSQSSGGSLTQLYHGDPYEYRSRLSAHAITYARTEQNEHCPPNTPINHTCTQEPLISCRHNDFPYPAQQRLFRGSLCHHCQLFPATCKNPFHYCRLLTALTMWEGFSASTLLSPLLLGRVHLSTPSLFLLCSPLFVLSFQGED